MTFCGLVITWELLTASVDVVKCTRWVCCGYCVGVLAFCCTCCCGRFSCLVFDCGNLDCARNNGSVFWLSMNKGIRRSHDDLLTTVPFHELINWDKDETDGNISRSSPLLAWMQWMVASLHQMISTVTTWYLGPCLPWNLILNWNSFLWMTSYLLSTFFNPYILEQHLICLPHRLSLLHLNTMPFLNSNSICLESYKMVWVNTKEIVSIRNATCKWTCCCSVKASIYSFLQVNSNQAVCWSWLFMYRYTHPYYVSRENQFCTYIN